MGMHGTEEKTMNPYQWDRAPRIGITTAYKSTNRSWKPIISGPWKLPAECR